MKSGAAKDYDFGQKNHWRRTLWNEVLRRTAGREKRELILYLAGPDDMDRDVATSKGVPSINLIAIDRNHRNVQSIRDDGNHAICGEVIDVLTTWPKGSPVCAIVLDFCQGFQKLDDLLRMTNLMGANPALGNAVIAVNMQRGRDAETNDIRDAVGTYIRRHMPTVDPKHRGMIFAWWYMSHHIATCRELLSLISQGETERRLIAIDAVYELFSPKIYSYRSGVLCFDSVVINSGSSLFEIAPGQSEEVASLFKNGKRSVALSTGATLAVRTRRLRELQS